eukprot:1283969-Amphidinium_carterae.1
MHHKLTLSPRATYNEKTEIQVDIESFADSDWTGCNTTRSVDKEEHEWDNHILMGDTLRHISRTQSTIVLSSAEFYAVGQATIEAQHIKQVIEGVKGL